MGLENDIKTEDAPAPAALTPDAAPAATNPTVTLSDEQATQFLQYAVGDTVTLTVTAKHEGDPGNSVTLEVASEAPDEAAEDLPAAPVEDADPEAEAAEEKVLGYKRPKTAKKAAPIDTNDLAD